MPIDNRRYAILSDIHSNLHALESVLADAQSLGVSEYICAGDLVGYGAYPNEVVDRMKSLNAKCIKGNHERAVLSGDVVGMNEDAADAVRWTIKNMTEETKNYLRSLSESRDLSHLGLFPRVIKVGLYHGSPYDKDDYVFVEGKRKVSDEYLDNALLAAKAQVVITGHTHVPFIKYLPHGIWVNPGAVGQWRGLPEYSDWRASYAIYDEMTKEFDFRQIEYPVKEAKEAIDKAGLPKWEGDRLLPPVKCQYCGALNYVGFGKCMSCRASALKRL